MGGLFRFVTGAEGPGPAHSNVLSVQENCGFAIAALTF